jgi:hypothetical protein
LDVGGFAKQGIKKYSSSLYFSGRKLAVFIAIGSKIFPFGMFGYKESQPCRQLATRISQFSLFWWPNSQEFPLKDCISRVFDCRSLLSCRQMATD